MQYVGRFKWHGHNAVTAKYFMKNIWEDPTRLLLLFLVFLATM